MNAHKPLQDIVDALPGPTAVLARGSRLPNPLEELECSKCGEVVKRCVLDLDEDCWRASPDGRYGPHDGNPDALSHDLICPECGEKNSFEDY